MPNLNDRRNALYAREAAGENVDNEWYILGLDQDRANEGMWTKEGYMR